MKAIDTSARILASWCLCITALSLWCAPLLSWCLDLLHQRQGLDVAYVSSFYFSLIWVTLFISFSAALMAVLFGTALACVATSSTSSLRDLVTISMTIPLLMGFIVRNYAWVALLGQMANTLSIPFSSRLSHALLNQRAGVVGVMAVVFTPFCYFYILQQLDSLSPFMLQAAQTLGATNARIFFVVVIPSIRRAQVLAFLASSVLAVGYFVTPQLIGGGRFQFIGNGVLTLLNGLGKPSDAALLAFMLLATVALIFSIMLALLRILNRVRTRSAKSTVLVAAPQTSPETPGTP
ncbi:MAG: hypothetical protein ABSE27_06535 [Acidobacteriaceae bacterium]